MKILWDENLAPSLVRRLDDLFPGSAHVHAVGLGSADDRSIWNFARQSGFTIATKDSDFQERAALEGTPPKVIWLHVGNCTVDQIEKLVRRHSATLHIFDQSATDAVLILV